MVRKAGAASAAIPRPLNRHQGAQEAAGARLPQGGALPQEGAQGARETQAEAVAWTQTLLVVTPNPIREVRAPLMPQRYLQAVHLRQLPAQALLLWRATRLSVLPARPWRTTPACCCSLGIDSMTRSC